MVEMSVTGDSVSSHEKRSADIGKSIWTSLLSEVSSRSTPSKLSGPEKNILIVGDDLSGKTTLAAKLNGIEDPIRISALEYHFIEVEDDDADEKAVCGVWILEGSRSHRSLLNFALPKERIANSIVIITADMSQPWKVMESLATWTTVLSEHIDQLKISAEDLRNFEKKVVEDFQKYVDPTDVTNEDSSIVSSALRLSTSNENEDQVVIPLGDSTLTCNLGIHLVVVCTKSDYTDKLESDHDYSEEHLDFIQYHLRTFCLKYGAALIYTSVKDNKNMEILHKYLLHKLYGLPFSSAASVVDKDAVFVPSGWDSEKKIAIIAENFVKLSPDQDFQSVISKPIMRKTLHDMKEVSAEDEQSFLTRAQSLLNAPSSGSSASRQSVPNRPPDMRLKGSQPGRTTIAGIPGSSANKIKSEKPAAQSNERVLANFFNSLLNKKPSPGSPQRGTADRPSTEAVKLQANSKSRNSPTKSQTEAS